jgi:hypothetical protein
MEKFNRSENEENREKYVYRANNVDKEGCIRSQSCLRWTFKLWQESSTYIKMWQINI